MSVLVLVCGALLGKLCIDQSAFFAPPTPKQEDAARAQQQPPQQKSPLAQLLQEQEPALESPAEPLLESPAEPPLESSAEPTLESPAEPPLEPPAEPLLESSAQPPPESSAEPPLQSSAGVATKVRGPRFPSIFPFRLVDAETDERAFALELAQTLNYPGAVLDLIATSNGARGKILYTLAELPHWMKVAAHVEPRRLDMRSRVRINRCTRIGKPSDPAVVKVSKTTDPAKLALSMQAYLFNRQGFVKGPLELRFLGKDAATVAMIAIERLHFLARRDIQFMPFFFKDGSRTTLAVSVEVPSASRRVAEGEVNEEDGEGSKTPAGGRPIDRQPSSTPVLFPTLGVGNSTPTAIMAGKITDQLEIFTVKGVELVIRDAARQQVAYTMASLPPWLEALGRIAPSGRNGKPRVRIFKDYTLPKPTREVMVSATTDPEKLSQTLSRMFFNSRFAPTYEVVLMKAAGPRAISVGMMAIEMLHWNRGREISFRAAFPPSGSEAPTKKTGVWFTVLVT